MRYVIRVKGHLNPFWQVWFEHLSITHQSDGTTLLSGPIRDQAALYGLLLKLRDLGLTLLELSAATPTSSLEERTVPFRLCPIAAVVQTTRDAS
jgi:hypothetical protein